MKILLIISTFISFSLFGQETAKVFGTVKSAINNEPLEYLVVSIAGTGTGVPTDSLGYYELYVPTGELTINVIYLGYNGIDTTLNIQESTELNFLIDANCEFDKDRAERDIRKNKAKLLLVGSIAPIANSKQDEQFMKKYKVKYFDFGDEVIAMECIEEYNIEIFQFLDDKYGSDWRNEARADVIALE
ncbi:MAG: carboxypeptidase-like regulatory domain-containing protein [Cyclobacteriaceae bacterium]